MKARLIVNHYLTAEKYSELNGLILSSASRHGIDMTMLTNKEVLTRAVMGGGIEKDSDFVLFWDKDVVLCRMIESLGVRCFNSASAIAACDNKGMTHACLSGSGIPMPQTIAAPMVFFKTDMEDTVKNAVKRLGLPLVIKESCGSFGQQVYLARDSEDAVDIANSISPKPMIFQKFIARSAGHDVRINVVGGHIAAAMERFSDSDFRANVTLGGSARAYKPTAEEEKIALDAARVLGLDFGGIDLLFGEDGPLLCEVNSNAHIKSILDCTGINVADEIFSYIGSEIR